MSNLLTLCGLWKSKDSSKGLIASGTMGNLNVLIFKNSKKTTEKQPDYNIVLAPKQRKETPQTEAVEW